MFSPLATMRAPIGAEGYPLTAIAFQVFSGLPWPPRPHVLGRGKFGPGSNLGKSSPAEFCRERTPWRSAGPGTPRSAFPTGHPPIATPTVDEWNHAKACESRHPSEFLATDS